MRGSEGRRPTIRVVAERAGVSPSTASRAFSKPELLLPSTVQRVLAAARELGYVPNHFARALTTGNRGALGLIVPDIANAFFPPLIRAVQAHAASLGLSTLLGDTDEDPANEPPLVERLSQQTDGIILASARMPDEEIAALAPAQPIVLVNRTVGGVPDVCIDSAVGIREAVRHLFELGHRSIAYLGGPETSWSNQQRREALEQAARRDGLTLMVLPPRRPEQAAGRAAVPEVLATGATAVIAFDDVLAQGLIAGLTAAGVAIPAEVSVVGCDDTIAIYAHPPLTTIRSSTIRAGQLAVTTLMEEICRRRVRSELEMAPVLSHRVPSELVVRSSTGAAPLRQ